MFCSLEGMRIMITGAAGGIGGGIAEECARAGALLHLVDRDPLVEELAVRLEAPGVLVADLGRPGEPQRVIAEAAAALGGLDGLVQAAGGQAPRRPLAELDDADWDALVAGNLTAALMGCRAAARVMDRGAIVNVGSVSASRGMADIVAYSATKAAVHQLTRGLAVELAPRVRVNTVAPGFVATPMTTAILDDPARRRLVEQRVPAGRVGEPGDVAAAVRYLLSDEASYVTGEVLTVDGGLLAG